MESTHSSPGTYSQATRDRPCSAFPCSCALLPYVVSCWLPACEQQSECSSFQNMLMFVCRRDSANMEFGIPKEVMDKVKADACLRYEGK